MNEQEYAGFWIRTWAAIIDTILLSLIVIPILTVIYGTDFWLSESLVMGVWDVVVSYIFPAVALIIFWIYTSASPGKLATKLMILDAKTGGKPSKGQFIVRYFAYFLSMIPLFLGYIWVGIDKRKQGFHDKIAGTVVVKRQKSKPST